MKLVPIFPLPDTVFFPHVHLPLHIFEPRYRQMTADALAGEGLLVVVLLKPGWDKDYYGAPPVHETATLGHIEHHEQLPDGRYNLVLQGVERVRLVEAASAEAEDPPRKLYRMSWITPAPEATPRTGSPAELEARSRLRSLWERVIQESGIHDPEKTEIPSDAVFEELVNRIAVFSGLSAGAKQSLLELDDLIERGRRLESALQDQVQFWSALNKFRALAPEDPRVN